MNDALHSPKRRIFRAKEHIRSLEGEIASFLNSKPYVYIAEPHANGLRIAHKIKFTQALPDRLSDLATDAADALRSALDQTCYAVVIASGKPDSSRNTHFPFGATAQEVDNALTKGRSKDIPSDIATLLRKLQPYKGGNDALWSLNRMRVANQHKFLAPIGMVAGGTHIKHAEITRGGIPFPRWNSDKNEIVFAWSQPGAEFKSDLQIAYTVAFGEVEIVGGQPAVPVLDRLAGEVEHIVSAIEVEGKRIGLLPS